jgi:multiple sugar transport system ATP-binding protein
VHFIVKAPVVMTQDMRELAADVDAALEGIEEGAATSESSFVARLSPRTGAVVGQPVELFVDTSRFHFFDPETDLAIYGDEG